MRASVEDLWCLDVKDVDMLQQLKAIVKPVVFWVLQMNNRVSASPAQSTQRSGTQSAVQSTSTTSGEMLPHLGQIDGVEEVVWSSCLGLKGQLDLIASGHNARPHLGPNHHSHSLIPLELKTGKRHPSAQMSHRAQVMFTLRHSYYFTLHLVNVR